MKKMIFFKLLVYLLFTVLTMPSTIKSHKLMRITTSVKSERSQLEETRLKINKYMHGISTLHCNMHLEMSKLYSLS